MINIKSGLLIFKNNTFQSIIVIILLIACFLGLGYISNFVNEQYFVLNKFKDFQGNIGVCYDKTSENKNIYAKLKNVESINCIYAETINDNDNKIYNCLSYDDFFKKYLDISLLEGNWYTDIKDQNGEFNAVIEEKSGLHIGDKIEWENEGETSIFNITGIIPDNFIYISLSNINDLNHYMKKSNKDYRPFLISDYKFTRKSNFHFILFDKNITHEALQKNYEVLNTYGNYAVLNDVYFNTKAKIDEKMKIYIPLISFFILLTISILVSVSLLTLDKSKTFLNIIKFCGSKKINYILTLLCYFSAMFLLPFIIFMCFFWYLYYIPLIVFAFVILFASLLGINLYKKEISKLNKE